MKLDIVYNKSSLEGMQEIEDASVKLLLTSPPYPKGMRDYDQDCCVEADKYVEWIQPFLNAAMRVLHPAGSMVIVLMDKILNGEIHPYIDDLKRCARKMGFKMIDDIVWMKCLAGNTYIYAKSHKGEMPMTIKDLARLKPSTVKLWNGRKWTQLLGVNRLPNKQSMLRVQLRSGEKISCSSEHKFPTQRGLVTARELKRGDVIQSVRLPEPEQVKDGLCFGRDAAWFAGLYLAEGSMSGDTIQISGHAKEESRWRRVRKIVKMYGGKVARTVAGNKMDIRVRGKLLLAIINTLLEGKTARGKALSSVCWGFSNDVLRELLDGYLSGDGHWDDKNGRWRLGFSRNYELERDLRTLCARLCYKLKLKRGLGKYKGAPYPLFRGEIRKSWDYAPQTKEQNEVISIGPASTGWIYDICVEDNPHLFALASGVLTHNSNALPNVNYARRPIRAYEHCLWFAKDVDLYTWNGNTLRKPYAATTLLRYGSVGRLETLHKRSGGSANQTWTDVEPNPLGAACNNIIYGSRYSGRKPGHPAKFPDYLPEWFISGLTNVGDVVLDPFAGSGTTLACAKTLDRNYIGFELSPLYYERCVDNLKHSYAQIEIE